MEQMTTQKRVTVIPPTVLPEDTTKVKRQLRTAAYVSMRRFVFLFGGIRTLRG